MSRGERLAQLFAQALPGGARDTFLAEIRAEDGALADELANLLAASSGGAGPLDEFCDEVRILAALEHPGISRFLDGGSRRLLARRGLQGIAARARRILR